MGDPAGAGDDGEEAGQAPVVDVALEVAVDAVQALGVEAQLGGVGLGAQRRDVLGRHRADHRKRDGPRRPVGSSR
jgi:hypothetical protein